LGGKIRRYRKSRKGGRPRAVFLRNNLKKKKKKRGGQPRKGGRPGKGKPIICGWGGTGSFPFFLFGRGERAEKKNGFLCFFPLFCVLFWGARWGAGGIFRPRLGGGGDEIFRRKNCLCWGQGGPRDQREQRFFGIKKKTTGRRFEAGGGGPRIRAPAARRFGSRAIVVHIRPQAGGCKKKRGQEFGRCILHGGPRKGKTALEAVVGPTGRTASARRNVADQHGCRRHEKTGYDLEINPGPSAKGAGVTLSW